ncbi:WecB/TagA/CpsF family glycosyltransferase [Bradyrhizobium japonicum]|uniref:WecB/TagA/CpsF family glycosyltransferase n=1 Tax=Bradyrhizobium japonicum TaxID=375 RepID=UPI001BA6297B|nr:WecB/TagA/CpsF family glycosyltransferase [Bradyrhizobium japonicum]MBR0916304.1 WecB/TagA/CpsF family glycosyltransferase [Bradyrhizobium japonicum]
MQIYISGVFVNIKFDVSAANCVPLSQALLVGTPVSTISLDQLLAAFETWTLDSQDRYVVFRDVHGIIAARNNAQLDLAHQTADIVAPDGMPLVWALRAAGDGPVYRVCGPDVLPAVCQHGLSRGWRHYFYGGAEGVADLLAEALVKKYPNLKIVGTQCPPFRPLTPEEDEIACGKIRAAAPDFVWVGLGTPKQEIWMGQNKGRCGGATMLGVGAAFDFHANLVRRAPSWMQRSGLEWAYRLFTEPKRLWKRYLVMAPIFVVLAAHEIIRRRW